MDANFVTLFVTAREFPNRPGPVSGWKHGRGGQDRTGDHLLPKQVRYRCATPRWAGLSHRKTPWHSRSQRDQGLRRLNEQSRLELREPERSEGIRRAVEPLWASRDPVANARFPEQAKATGVRYRYATPRSLELSHRPRVIPRTARTGSASDRTSRRFMTCTAGLVSAPTRSSRLSARAAWARSTGRGTRGSGERSRSRSCRPRSVGCGPAGALRAGGPRGLGAQSPQHHHDPRHRPRGRVGLHRDGARRRQDAAGALAAGPLP